MNDIPQTAKFGGKQKGAGRPKGSITAQTKQKIDALKMYRERVSVIAGKLLEAQTVEALGFHKMVRIELKKNKKHKELYTVKDPEEFDSLLSDGVCGVDYLLVAAAAPNYKASESILNRAFGRPTETVEVSGRDGQPMIIRLDT